MEPIIEWTEGSGFDAEEPTQQQVPSHTEAERRPPGFGKKKVVQVFKHVHRMKKLDQSFPTVMTLRETGTAVHTIDLVQTNLAEVQRFFVEMSKKGLLSIDETNVINFDAINWFSRIRAKEVEENERRRIERGQMSRAQFAKRTRAALTADPSESKEPMASKRQKTQ